MVTETISDTISRLGRQVSDATIFMHEAIARKAGLSGTDHKYLRLILEKGTLTAGELSSLTGLTTGAVTGLTDRLEKRDLVKRRLDGADRRKVFIVANTDEANKLFATVHLDLKAQIENLLSEFSPQEIQTIEKYLSSAVQVMNKVTDKLNGK